jgi:hypothetical protein
MRGRWRPSNVVVTALLLVTVIGVRLVDAAVDAQEERLLEQRSNEVSLVLGNTIDGFSDGLGDLGTVMRATESSPTAFSRTARAALAGDDDVAVAVLTERDGRWVVWQSEGSGLAAGEELTGERAAAVERATRTKELVPTGVVSDGAARVLGFALGPPASPPDTVLYRESTLGPLSAPQSTESAPFSDLEIALYASAVVDAERALVSTTDSTEELPLAGEVKETPFFVGDTRWTLQVSPTRSLVGSVTANAAWVVAGLGILVALLVGAVVESVTRRRDTAVALYDSEHQLAEKLQRGFLPDLPDVPGLETAARYLAGSVDQQVGGDWYDLFVLPHGETGVVIGDVLGHDVNAAVVMSRIQTALRAFASQGAEPHDVLDSLDEHLVHVQADRLTTLFYGILGAPDADGARTFRFANAGHLHPLVRHADSHVEELVTSRSVLVGVGDGYGAGRTQSTVTLEPGATLVLFTDGLVEVPGASLTERLKELARTLSTAPGDPGPDLLCARLISHLQSGERRDDVAVLAVRLTTD